MWLAAAGNDVPALLGSVYDTTPGELEAAALSGIDGGALLRFLSGALLLDALAGTDRYARGLTDRLAGLPLGLVPETPQA